MKKISILLLTALMLSVGLYAQSFSKSSALLPGGSHSSGVAIAVADMNNDGRDDIIRLQNASTPSVLLQRPGLSFIPVTNIGNGNDEWGMCVADVDNNGYSDILYGGFYNGVKILRANNNGTGYTTTNYTSPDIFVQGVNFADVNNDGWLDAFVCHDDGAAQIFGNNGNGTFSPQQWINLETSPVSDNSGNYGSVWSDIDNDGDMDLYIAKCRQGVNDPTDPRRINQLFINNGAGLFKQDITNEHGLRIGAQSWTADFGDIDNDGDFDCFITNHDVSSQLLENDGSGHFTDISLSANIQDVVTGLPIQGIFRDFDNDGFVDILVAGTQHYLFHNNGDKTFTNIPNFLGSNVMESYALGDLNTDGFIDIYAGYAQVFNQPTGISDDLWLNDGNGNHFFSLRLRGVQTNKDGVGAKIYLYTPQGLQLREIRSGEGYGISNALQAHFGIGTQTTIDSVVVFWPSGIKDILINPSINQHLTLVEGGSCLTSLLTIPSSQLTLCVGDTLHVAAPDGYTEYLWSNGDTTATAAITAAGNYQVTATDANGCSAVSNIFSPVVDPIKTPTIQAASDTIFCTGGSVTLTASPADTYVWSTGETTASIVVSTPGEVLVTTYTNGDCQDFTSNPVTVRVLDNQSATVVNDTTWIDGPALLTATGDSLVWYDAPTGGNIVTTGDSLSLTSVPATATYWVEAVKVYSMPSVSGGMINHAGSNFSDNSTNGQVIFDSYQSFILSKVKVYTNTAGERRIILRNAQNEEIASKTVMVPQGTNYIDLGFVIPVGNNLVLTTDATVNQANLGSLSPQLRRSNQQVAYPYITPGVVSVKGSNFGIDRYYYFYDWKIDFPSYTCIGPRVPVTATVDENLTDVVHPTQLTAIQCFPNPTATGLVTAYLRDVSAGSLQYTVQNALGAVIETRQLHWAGGSGQINLDLSRMPAGIYQVEWRTASGQFQTALAKQ